jgi:SAM-dependent methyltransferase
MDRYCIPTGYQTHNHPAHHDDTEFSGDEYQGEVYAFARRLMESRGLRSVLDIGCGNGYKLVTYLGEFDTVGVEVEPSLSFLRRTYPNRLWLESGEASESFVLRSQEDGFDLVLCADVIEHIKEPDAFMDAIRALQSRFVLFSTPDREILAANPPWDTPMLGPPDNPTHVREWTFAEFRLYLSRYFSVIESLHCSEQFECQLHLCQGTMHEPSTGSAAGTQTAAQRVHG